MKEPWQYGGTPPDGDSPYVPEEFKRGAKWGVSIMDLPVTQEEQRRLNKEATERIMGSAPLKKVEYLGEDEPLYPEEPEAEQRAMKTPADRKVLKEGDSPFHFESGKSRVDQIPPRALMTVGEVFGYGAKKYGDWNWAQYQSEWKWGQLIGSTLRHVYAWMARQDIDHESGLPHLAHAAANLLMLIELIMTGNQHDDRNPIGQSRIEIKKGNIGTL